MCRVFRQLGSPERLQPPSLVGDVVVPLTRAPPLSWIVSAPSRGPPFSIMGRYAKSRSFCNLWSEKNAVPVLFRSTSNTLSSSWLNVILCYYVHHDGAVQSNDFGRPDDEISGRSLETSKVSDVDTMRCLSASLLRLVAFFFHDALARAAHHRFALRRVALP